MSVATNFSATNCADAATGFSAADFAEGLAAEAGPLTARVVRKLMAADGYLQLGLPAAALKELDALSDVDCGPLASARDYLAGQSLMADDRHEDALAPLQRAAETIPAPWNRAAYESLSVCFRAAGQDELADVTDFFGDDDGVPPGFDPDAAVCEDDFSPATAGSVGEFGWNPTHDPAEAAAASYEEDACELAAWESAEPFGDAADLHVPEEEETVGLSLWVGDDAAEEEDAVSFDDLAAEADALEPGRPAEWTEAAFDGGFGTDETDRPLPPSCR